MEKEFVTVDMNNNIIYAGDTVVDFEGKETVIEKGIHRDLYSSESHIWVLYT